MISIEGNNDYVPVKSTYWASSDGDLQSGIVSIDPKSGDKRIEWTGPNGVVVEYVRAVNWKEIPSCYELYIRRMNGYPGVIA
jgi:hypothetical protein